MPPSTSLSPLVSALIARPLRNRPADRQRPGRLVLDVLATVCAALVKPVVPPNASVVTAVSAHLCAHIALVARNVQRRIGRAADVGKPAAGVDLPLVGRVGDAAVDVAQPARVGADRRPLRNRPADRQRPGRLVLNVLATVCAALVWLVVPPKASVVIAVSAHLGADIALVARNVQRRIGRAANVGKPAAGVDLPLVGGVGDAAVDIAQAAGVGADAGAFLNRAADRQRPGRLVLDIRPPSAPHWCGWWCRQRRRW